MISKIYEKIARRLGFKSVEDAIIKNFDLFSRKKQMKFELLKKGELKMENVD